MSSPPTTAKRGLSLQVKLTGMMLLTIGATAAIVHFPWAYTSRQNVEQMVSTLHEKSFQGAQNDAAAFFDNLLSLQNIIVNSLDNGLIELADPAEQGLLYLNLLQANQNITWIQIGFANGDFLGVQHRPDGLYNLDQRQWDDTLGELGAPGTALATRQAQRSRQAASPPLASDSKPDGDQPQWTVKTYQFTAANAWQQVDTTRREAFYYAPARPYYQAALQQPGKPVWTDVYRFHTDNVVGLDTAITYHDPDTGVLRGVVSISFGLRRISEYLADLRKPGEGLLFIMDGAGNLVAASDPSILDETFASATAAELVSLAAIDEPLLQGVNQALADQNIVLEELTGLREFQHQDDRTGDRYYIALSPLGRLDWVIGSVTPEEVFLGRVNRNQQRLLLVILGLLGGGMAVLWQISDRLLMRPILAVSDAAAAMETGTFTGSAALDQTAHREDELGQLAAVFQNMAAVIGDREKSLMAQLEDLRDGGTSMAGSQLEVAYYQSLLERAAHRRSSGVAGPAFPPAATLSAYYHTLKERATAARLTHSRPSEVEHMLRREDYLAMLPDGDVRALANSAQRQTYGAGEFIFQEGDGAQAVYVLALGSVAVLSPSQDEPLRLWLPGQVFGDLTLMLDCPRTTSIRTQEPTVVFRLAGDTFTRILRQNPQVIAAVERKLVHHQELLAEAQLWLSAGDRSLAAGATWLERARQQLRYWWHGQLMEN